MNELDKTAAFLMGAVVVVILGCVLITAGYSMRRDARIEDLIKGGEDPILARCALENMEAKLHSLCLVRASR